MKHFRRWVRGLVGDIAQRRLDNVNGELMAERSRRIQLVQSLRLVDGLLSSGKPNVAQSQLRAILIREG